MALISHDQREKHQRAKFPPVISSVEFFGEIKEDDGLLYSRNIGCSSLLGGFPIFLFGDTYVLKPPLPHFVGVSSSTASMGSFSNPLSTHYPSFDKDDEEYGNHRIPDFIPFTSAEDQHNALASINPEQIHSRFYLSICSSVIEVPSEPGVGVVWFIKGKTNDSSPENDSYYGIGVAEVEMKQLGVVDEEFGGMMPVATRHGDVIFDSSNPQWGNVATLLDGEYIYLYGTQHEVHLHHHHRRLRRKAGGSPIGFVENPVFLCRVPHAKRAYLLKEKYTYWDGEKFVPALSSLTPPSMTRAQAKNLSLGPAMYNIQSATVFHTKLFSRTEEGLFVLIGCDGSGDGKVRFKIAENPWGPWKGDGCLVDLGIEDRGNKGAKSCVYAHLWASNLDKGEIVLTWAEPWPGGIEMARIGFGMMDDDDDEKEREEEQTICSNDSMFGSAEQHPFQETHGGPMCGVANADSECTMDEWERERLEARRKTLAKLSGQLDEDYQEGAFLQYPDYCSLIGRGPFSSGFINGRVSENNVIDDPFAGFEDMNHDKLEHQGDEDYGESEDAETVGGGESGRLTRLLRETWYREQTASPDGRCEKAEDRARYAGDTWSAKDIEEGSPEDSPGNPDSETEDSEADFSAPRYSFYRPLGLRVMNPTIGSPSDVEDETPAVIHTSDDLSHRPTHSDSSITTSSSTDWVPVASLQQQLQQQQQQQCEQNHLQYQDHHQSAYWGSLSPGSNEEAGVSLLAEGGMSGYKSKEYITNLSNGGSHQTRFYPQSWTAKRREAPKLSKKQETSWDFGEQTSINSMRKWVFGKVLGKGKQKMAWIKEEETSEEATVPTSKGQKGLKKKLSGINLRWAGKSVINLHRKVDKTEVNLQKFSLE